ncbi:hypothetical protein HK101_002837 [Irineochytrium annulatum]|nr:hypothetical protein HK101_002837 [Irineochytrium annulatum]
MFPVPPVATSIVGLPTWRIPVPGYDLNQSLAAAFIAVVSMTFGLLLALRINLITLRRSASLTVALPSHSGQLEKQIPLILVASILAAYIAATIGSAVLVLVFDISKMFMVIGALHNASEVVMCLVLQRRDGVKVLFPVMGFYVLSLWSVCSLASWPVDGLYFKWQGLTFDCLTFFNAIRLYHANKDVPAPTADGQPLLPEQVETGERAPSPSPIANRLKLVIAASFIHAFGNIAATVDLSVWVQICFSLCYAIAYPLYGYFVYSLVPNDKILRFKPTTITEMFYIMVSLAIATAIIRCLFFRLIDYASSTFYLEVEEKHLLKGEKLEQGFLVNDKISGDIRVCKYAENMGGAKAYEDSWRSRTASNHPWNPPPLYLLIIELDSDTNPTSVDKYYYSALLEETMDSTKMNTGQRGIEEFEKRNREEKVLIAGLLALFAFAASALAWEKEDFEIFDLHDSLMKIKGEKGPNGEKIDFYSVLEVGPSATQSQITRAYRKMSLNIHPDKNPDPESNALYALLTSIQAILKDAESRERYDRHRARGIPTWRGTGYFLAKYKPGVAFIVTFIIGMISVAQYLIQYIMFHQRRVAPAESEDSADSNLTYAQIRKKLKRAGVAESPALKKAIKDGVPPAEIVKLLADGKLEGEAVDIGRAGKEVHKEEVAEMEAPRLSDTLICQIPIGAFNMLRGLFGGKKKAVDDDAEFVPDEDAVEEEEATPRGGGGGAQARSGHVAPTADKKAAPGAGDKKSGMKPSEKKRLERLGKIKQKDEGAEETEEVEKPAEKRKKKMMSKQDIIEQIKLKQQQARSLKSFYSYGEVEKNLRDAANEHPDLVSFITVGKTVEGREIPGVIVARKPHTEEEHIGIDMRPAVLFTGTTQPREVLSAMQIMYMLKHMVKQTVRNDSSSESQLVTSIVSTTQTILVPIINVDGFQEAKSTSSDGTREHIVKNLRPTCGHNVTASGVNLAHNYGFMWDSPASPEGFTDPCNDNYRGDAAFSEPETQAIRDLILEHKPKAAVFFHSRSKSETSRIIVPYMYHKSFLSAHRGDKKGRLMRQADLTVYDSITASMDDNRPKSTDEYEIGTAWELMNRTISGSEIDWAFDEAGIWSIIVQIGTADNSYWPRKENVMPLLEKHLKPALVLAQMSSKLPAKQTPKTHIAYTVSLIPLFLGLALAVTLLFGYGIARYLGYDRIVERFTTFMLRFQRAFLQSRYSGLSTGAKENDNEDLNFDDLELEGGLDDDDEGVGHTYR